MDQERTGSSSPSSLPTLRYAVGTAVVPGDRLCTIRHVAPGEGTYVRGGHVHASVVGILGVVPAATAAGGAAAASTAAADDRGGGGAPPNYYRAVVQPSRPIASRQVLSVGDVVLARVVRIAAMQAFVDILAFDRNDRDGYGTVTTARLLFHPCEGTIRREDVRSGASEQVQIRDSFLPSDLVLARVLSMGDARRYHLTTASPELGVIYATAATEAAGGGGSSKKGPPMVPVSWKEMQCPVTGRKELRKCARPRAVDVDPAAVSSAT